MTGPTSLYAKHGGSTRHISTPVRGLGCPGRRPLRVATKRSDEERVHVPSHVQQACGGRKCVLSEFPDLLVDAVADANT